MLDRVAHTHVTASVNHTPDTVEVVRAFAIGHNVGIAVGHRRSSRAVVSHARRDVRRSGRRVDLAAAVLVQRDVHRSRVRRSHRVNHRDHLDAVAEGNIAASIHHTPCTREGVGTATGRGVLTVRPAHRRSCRAVVVDSRRIAGRTCRSGAVNRAVSTLVQRDVCRSYVGRGNRILHRDGLDTVAERDVTACVNHTPCTREGVGTATGRGVLTVRPAHRRSCRAVVVDSRRIAGRTCRSGAVNRAVSTLVQRDVYRSRVRRTNRVKNGDMLDRVAHTHVTACVNHTPDTVEVVRAFAVRHNVGIAIGHCRSSCAVVSHIRRDIRRGGRRVNRAVSTLVQRDVLRSRVCRLLLIHHRERRGLVSRATLLVGHGDRHRVGVAAVGRADLVHHRGRSIVGGRGTRVLGISAPHNRVHAVAARGRHAHRIGILVRAETRSRGRNGQRCHHQGVRLGNGERPAHRVTQRVREGHRVSARIQTREDELAARHRCPVSRIGGSRIAVRIVIGLQHA